jgi:hypothetical protein
VRCFECSAAFDVSAFTPGGRQPLATCTPARSTPSAAIAASTALATSIVRRALRAISTVKSRA